LQTLEPKECVFAANLRQPSYARKEKLLTCANTQNATAFVELHGIDA